MKNKKSALNVCFKVISIFLSIALVISLIVTVLCISARNLISADTITDLISDIDYSDIVDELEKPIVPQSTLSFTPAILMESNAFTTVKVKDNDDSKPAKFYIDSDGNAASANSAEGGMTITFDGESYQSYDKDTHSHYSAIGVESSNGAYVSQFGGADNSTVKVEDGFGGADNSTVKVEDGFGGAGDYLAPSGNDAENEISKEDIKEIAGAFLETDAGKELMDVYIEAVEDAIDGGDGEIDEERLKEVIRENKEEIYDLYERETGETIDREEWNSELDKLLDENFDDLMAQIPAPSTIVKEIPTTVLSAISIINSKSTMLILFIVDFVLMALIFVMRLWDWAGFLWLSVNGIVSSSILALVYLAITLAKNVAIDGAGKEAVIIEGIVGALLNSVLMGVIIIFVVSVIFMVTYFVLKSVRRKKAEPIQQ